MPRRVTIVMYHFVRDRRRSRFPAIAGLDTSSFLGQLDYIQRHYNVISVDDVLAASQNADVELPPRALLLTFDDGYIDHFTTVFPALEERGWSGAFFPPARAILERRVLDVNKIHFVLASEPDKAKVVHALEQRVEAHRAELGLLPVADYRNTYAHANRWDSADVIYIKRMLQRGLPQALRSSIADELFRQFVTHDEAAFAEELYVSAAQLRCMIRHGMHIGSHSHDHVWLDSLDADAQAQQIAKSVEFLRLLHGRDDKWTICYPYGGYNSSLLAIVQQHGFQLGFTTNVAVSDLDKIGPLELSRLDTNDLPNSADAPPNHWLDAA